VIVHPLGRRDERELVAADLDGLDPDQRLLGARRADPGDAELAQRVQRRDRSRGPHVELVVVGEVDVVDAVLGQGRDLLGQRDEPHLLGVLLRLRDRRQDRRLEVRHREVGDQRRREVGEVIAELGLLGREHAAEEPAEHDVAREHELDPLRLAARRTGRQRLRRRRAREPA
jgi:hypothetical protein